ncbi:MAG: VOC family protein [Elusimicrobiota bacterium]
MAEKTNPVGWFEIPVKDMARARAFYEHVLGLALEEHDLGPLKMAWFPMSESAVGSAGALVLGETYEPSARGTLVYFTAPDIPAALRRAAEKGGKVLVEKKSIGAYGFVGVLEDCEGNRVALHSRA